MSVERPGTTPEVVHAPRAAAGAMLDDALLAVFRSALTALEQGRPVVAVVAEEDILGRGEPLDAAAAHAVVGLVRSLAIEGADDGWQINAISAPASCRGAELTLWIERLAAPAGASGTVLRLGSEHLGRVGL